MQQTGSGEFVAIHGDDGTHGERVGEISSRVSGDTHSAVEASNRPGCKSPSDDLGVVHRCESDAKLAAFHELSGPLLKTSFAEDSGIQLFAPSGVSSYLSDTSAAVGAVWDVAGCVVAEVVNSTGAKDQDGSSLVTSEQGSVGAGVDVNGQEGSQEEADVVGWAVRGAVERDTASGTLQSVVEGTTDNQREGPGGSLFPVSIGGSSADSSSLSPHDQIVQGSEHCAGNRETLQGEWELDHLQMDDGSIATGAVVGRKSSVGSVLSAHETLTGRDVNAHTGDVQGVPCHSASPGDLVLQQVPQCVATTAEDEGTAHVSRRSSGNIRPAAGKLDVSSIHAGSATLSEAVREEGSEPGVLPDLSHEAVVPGVVQASNPQPGSCPSSEGDDKLSPPLTGSSGEGSVEKGARPCHISSCRSNTVAGTPQEVVVECPVDLMVDRAAETAQHEPSLETLQRGSSVHQDTGESSSKRARRTRSRLQCRSVEGSHPTVKC